MDTDDFAHPDYAEHHHDERHSNQLDASRGGVQDPKEARIQNRDQERYRKRQDSQNPRRQPPFGRQHPDLAEQRQPAADDLADVAENFSQVAAALPLDQNRDHEITQVADWYAV